MSPSEFNGYKDTRTVDHYQQAMLDVDEVDFEKMRRIHDNVVLQNNGGKIYPYTPVKPQSDFVSKYSKHKKQKNMGMMGAMMGAFSGFMGYDDEDEEDLDEECMSPSFG